MKTQFAYSYNEENYHGYFDSVEHALNEAWAEKDRDVCWIGEIVQPTAMDFIPDAGDILDHMVNQAADEGPEMASDYLDPGPDREKLRAITPDLQAAIAGVFEKHGVDLAPHWFTVKDVQKHEREIGVEA